MNLSSSKLPRLSDWLEQAKATTEREDALWLAVQTAAGNLPHESAEHETLALLDSLLALKVSPDVLLAAALANWPALHTSINPKQEGLPRLQPLLEGSSNG